MSLYHIRQRFQVQIFEHLCDSYGIKRKPTTVKKHQGNAVLERAHQVLGQMLRTSELNMADSVSPNDVDVFLFAVAITQYLKPHQAPPFLDETCSLTFRSWPTGTKLENIGNYWQIVVTSVKTNDASITIIRSVIKYSWLKMVYSANLSLSMAKSHGL